MAWLLLLLAAASSLQAGLGSVAANSELAWESALATVYGDESGTINGGACGFDFYNNHYGTNTAAVSSMLFNSGTGCGSCFEIKCDTSVPDAAKRCAVGKTVVVTATNLCPASSVHPNAWCNPPNKHFDLTSSAFSQIAGYSSGTPVSVLFRSVPCSRQGGMQFTINGNSRYNLVLLSNVGGTGVVKSVSVKGTKTGWLPLMRSWGSNWQTPQDLRGQSLSFEVKLSDGTTVISYDVIPASWKLGQTFEGKQVP